MPLHGARRPADSRRAAFAATCPDPARLAITAILAFNERVLDWAQRPEVPLIERLRYLCIVSSNLDEFFEVRAAPHLIAASARRAKGNYTVESLRAAGRRPRMRWWGASTRSTTNALMPAFAAHGIQHHFARRAQPGAAQVGARVFRARGAPAADSGGPRSRRTRSRRWRNKSLNFIVRLGGKDAFGRENPIAILEGAARAAAHHAHAGQGVGRQDAVRGAVERGAARICRACSPAARWASSRSSASRASPTWRWTRRTSRTCAPRCARAWSTATTARPCGWRCSASCAESLASFLLAQFNLPPRALYRVHGPVNLARAHAAHRPARRAAVQRASPPYQAFLPGHAVAGPVLLRPAAARRRADPPALRELRRACWPSCARRCSTRRCWRSSRPSTAPAPIRS